jgi:multisubunit Na+/H+ antiporter MnhF subunit
VTAYELAVLLLLVGGLGPAAMLGCRGTAPQRLVGLQLGGTVTVLLLTVFAQATGQSSSLIVPTVLAVLAVTGTLVFTRLLAPHR